MERVNWEQRLLIQIYGLQSWTLDPLAPNSLLSHKFHTHSGLVQIMTTFNWGEEIKTCIKARLYYYSQNIFSIFKMILFFNRNFHTFWKCDFQLSTIFESSAIQSHYGSVFCIASDKIVQPKQGATALNMKLHKLSIYVHATLKSSIFFHGLLQLWSPSS